jgi:hypothetical protein
MTKVLIYLPENLKAKRDGEYTISGYVWTVLEKEFNQPAAKAARRER